MGLLDEARPLKDETKNYSRTGSAKEHFLKFSRKNKSFILSAKVILDLDIIYGMRIGLVRHPPNAKNYNPFLVLIYFTNNDIGTIKLNKYPTSSWKVSSTDIVEDIYKRFNKNNSYEDFKLYVNMSLPVKLNINGMPELCYPLFDKVDLRKDVNQDYKDRYNSAIREIYKELV